MNLKSDGVFSFANAKVLVCGDVMLDRYWFGDVDRISPEAPVPVLLVGQSEERLGGAANVALNAATLGARVALLGAVGKDEAAQLVRNLLLKNNIDQYLLATEAMPTTVKLRVVARQQQMVRVDFERKLKAEDVLPLLSQFNAVLSGLVKPVAVFSDYAKGALSMVTDMITICRNQGLISLVDPKGEDYQKYHGATVLTPNRHELRQVVGGWQNEQQLYEKAQALRIRLNLGALLLTRAEEGMTLFQEEGVQHFPAQAREVFDVSGAGDTVIATLACGLASGLALPKAVALANQAGGIVVGKLGTATVLPTELFSDGVL